ncbi:hypothetical protein [Mycolicibacterium mageritense]|uniref:hypothetical protein n=1 Tax=Mycolicibacterium mageritense TaxID=53462 RepID=UPI0011D50A71|nr:hypothetical protein [Mycolicibacterium mageritense]TXI51941.1 MAG: hypothetical protein E6Q55_37795 [Mycolicibacterium mageritense]
MARWWDRYEVVRLTADQNRRGSTISRRDAAYPFRWMADRKAWRSEAKHAGIGGEVRYVVREITPEIPPKYWPALQVNQASRWYQMPPSAHVTSGSVIVHTSIGITRWHALGRACKWAKPRSLEFVRVSRWSDERRFFPSDDHDERTSA